MLNKMGYTAPTEIQAAIIPSLFEGRDCLAQAPTGTGKTASFGIPIVSMVDTANPKIQAIILAPTRELVMQIEGELRRLAAFNKDIRILSIYGGQNIQRQLAGIRQKPQIIVGTTGRVMDHLRRRTFKLSEIKIIVLDEADEMLDMGFREDIDTILMQMPDKVQTLLFSATIPKEIAAISEKYQSDPVRVTTTIKGNNTPTIAQKVLYVSEKDKYAALKDVIDENKYTKCLVFTNTRNRAQTVADKLIVDGYSAMALHGELMQRQRDKAMNAFRRNEINILVATDIAARGIDVSSIQAIFNYDLPSNGEYYLHRIGRTARASSDGIAYSFVSNVDYDNVKACERAVHTKMSEIKLKSIAIDTAIARRNMSSDQTRFFVTIGSKDYVTPEKLKSFITSKANITESEIKDVKIMELFSFVEISSNKTAEMLTLNGEKAFKRNMVVEVASERKVASRGGSRLRASNGSYGARDNDDKPKKLKNDGTPYVKRPDDKPFFGKNTRKPYEKSDRKPYEKTERKPFDKERKHYEKSERKPFDKSETKPYEKSTDEKRSYSKPSTDRKPYEKTERRPYEKADRKPFDKERKSYDKSTTERKPYEKTDRKPFEKSTDGKGAYSKSTTERKPYEKSERKPYEKTERKPYEKSERKPYEKSASKPYDKSKSAKPYSKPRPKPVGQTVKSASSAPKRKKPTE